VEILFGFFSAEINGKLIGNQERQAIHPEKQF
jgi:hypothetical protein